VSGLLLGIGAKNLYASALAALRDVLSFIEFPVFETPPEMLPALRKAGLPED
jgi:hypothetical protein